MASQPTGLTEALKENIVSCIQLRYPECPLYLVKDVLSTADWNVARSLEVIGKCFPAAVSSEAVKKKSHPKSKPKKVVDGEKVKKQPKPLFVQKTGATPNPTKPRSTKSRTNKTELKKNFDLISQLKDPLDRIGHLVKAKVKLIIVMRGCPGSGKTTLAKEILTNLGAPNATHHLVSADDYFVNETGHYRFVPEDLPKAHIWAQKLVQLCALEGRSPIIVDNTHTRLWEMKNVCTIAVANGYVVEIVEPRTPWCFVEDQLHRKTTHGVGRESIQRMLLRYESHGIIGVDLLARHALAYKPNKAPPQRCLVSFEAQISKKHLKMLSEKKVELPPPKPKPAPAPNPMNRALPSGPMVWVKDPLPKPASAPLVDLLSFDDPTIDDRPSGEVMSSYLSDLLDLDFTQEATSVAGADSDDSLSDDDTSSCGASSLSSFATCQESVGKPEPMGELNDFLKPYLSQMGIQSTEMDGGGSFTYVEPPNAELLNRMKALQLKPATRESSTNTHYIDFDIVKHAAESGGCLNKETRILSGRLDRFKSGTPTKGFIPTILMLDKGNMTTAVDENVTVEKTSGLDTLASMFPEAERECLEELFERCHKNLDWAVNVMLDSGHNLADSFNSDVTLEVTEKPIPVEEPPLPTSLPPIRQKKVKPKLSEDGQELVKHLEENIVLNDSCYSDRLKKVRETKLGIPFSPASSSSIDSPATETDGSDAPDTEEMSLIVNSNFVSQLNLKFGNLLNVMDDELVVKLPVQLARQLYSYIVDAAYQEMEEQETLMYDLIHQGDELAQKLYQEEVDRVKGGMSLAEIMDHELAIRTSQKKSGSEPTIASTLSKQLLIERFPNMDPSSLTALLEDTNHSLHQATMLLAAAGHEPLEQSEPSNSVSESLNGHTASRGESIVQASAYTEMTSQLYRLRKECLEKARRTFQQGNKGVAYFYSEMGKWYMERIQESNSLAAKAMLCGHETATTIDLHFLMVPDALRVLDLFVDENLRQLQTNHVRKRTIYIITGRGAHSHGGMSRIKPAVEARLNKRGIKFQDENPGMLRADISNKSNFSYSTDNTKLESNLI